MLVEPDAVIAQPIELLPGFEMFGVSPRRDLRFEIFLLQRVGQLAPDLQVLKLFTVSQEIEYKNLHYFGASPSRLAGPPVRGSSRETRYERRKGVSIKIRTALSCQATIRRSDG